MFDIINATAVLVASVIAYIAGWIWYSPILWQRPWMEALGRTDADLGENSKSERPKIMAYGFTTILAIAFSVAVFLTLTEVTTLLEYLQVGLLLCFGFVITTKFSDMLYSSPPPASGRKAQTLFLIDAGYQVALFSILSSVIWYISNMQ